MTTRRPIDSVQIAGWTSDTVTRAVGLLAVAPCADPDEAALAHELIRWLRCEAHEGAAQMVDYLDTIRPTGANASPWDKLVDSLCEEPLADVIVRLHAERPDLVSELCALLDDDAKRCWHFDGLQHEAQCAVKGLMMLGTAEGLRYLLTHIALLCWNDTEAFNHLAHPHRDAFGRAAVDVWEALDWATRATLLLVFVEQDLPVAPLVDLLLAVDGEKLGYGDRTLYVHALSFSGDAQAIARIHELVNRALESPTSLSVDGKQFVAESICYLSPNSLTADQRRRIAECGIDLRACGSETMDIDRSDAIH